MADEAAPQTKRNTTLVTLIIVLVVALLEGGAFLVVIKFFGGGPRVTYGEDSAHVVEGEEVEEEQSSTEVELLKSFKVPNNKTGHTIIHDFDISVVVPEPRQDEMKDIATNQDAEIRDRVAQIVRQARPRVLDEDDFGTLRMMLKRTLSEVVGDDQMVQRVLIPRHLPIRVD